MTKQCIIGDIHERTIWKRIVEKEKDSDRFIFLGDYLDSYEKSLTPIEAADNLEDIIEFKKNQQRLNKDVVLLLGNHILQYSNIIYTFVFLIT